MNPFIQMAVFATTMKQAFHENALRDYYAKHRAGRSSRRSGNGQERGIVPKAFRQYAARYGHGVQSLRQAHNAYRMDTLDEAARTRQAERRRRTR